MAADADAADGQLSKKMAKAPSPASPDHSDEGSPASREESEAMTTATTAEPEAADEDTDEAEDHEDAVDDEVDDASEDAAPVELSRSHLRLAAIVTSAVVVALAVTVGWLGFQTYQSHQTEKQRQLFLQVGRQCALNLTTIDWQHAEDDVQRVLDSATGQFYDQFSKRKQPFIEVLKKAQSKSVGTITEAGVESASDDKAQVLVAVSIKTTNLGAAEEAPREWRMRISVEKSGGEVKISNVAFVP